MQEKVKSIIESRSKRVCRVILDAKDEFCDANMDHEDSMVFRETVLDQVNDFKNLCIQLVEAVDVGAVSVNELWLEKLDEIHKQLCR